MSACGCRIELAEGKQTTTRGGEMTDVQQHEPTQPDFFQELSGLLNRFSQENASNTPDWILAHYLTDCLKAFASATERRESWYGHGHRPGGEIVSLPTTEIP